MTRKARYQVRVQWGDCDAAQHMYYPNYFRLFDTSTHNLMEQAGYPLPDIFRDYEIMGMPIVDAQASFRTPCTWGDRLEVESRVSEWRNKSFVISHTVWKDDTVMAEGREIRICACPHPDDPERMVAGLMPPEIKSSLEEDEGAAS